VTKKDVQNMEKVEKRLDVVIHILLRQTQLQEMTSRDHINFLSSLGLRDVEIARILGRTRGYVASELSKIKSKSEKNVK
jgi:DNA-binding CsgD family transcriptional regulator